MINWMTNVTKERIIREIRQILYNHPRYREDSQNVSVSYSFKERPQRGVIVNSTSGDQVRLSADNFMGQLSSFCMLTTVKEKPGTTLEWVRENFNVLEETSPDRNIFPSPPGVYFIDIKKLPDDARNVPGEFTVEPVLTIKNEPLILFSSSGDFEAQIPRENLYPGSVRLWLDNRKQLIRYTDYNIDEATGAVTFLQATPTGSNVHVDYRYTTGVQGPFFFHRDESNVDAIPGAVLAFGDRCQECDSQAIVITDERTHVAGIYGGKFEISFDLIAFVRNDAKDRDKLSDYLIHSILDIQGNLANEGLELISISPSGESAEIYNAEDDTYYYESNISFSLRVDWETWIPLPIVISRAELTSRDAEQEFGWLTGDAPEDLLQATSSLIGMDVLPVKTGKSLTYERIR
jgi:hypothetical protein